MKLLPKRFPLNSLSRMPAKAWRKPIPTPHCQAIGLRRCILFDKE
jgi:hypothetical protein